MSDSHPDPSEAVVSIPLESLSELGMEALHGHCTEAGLRDFTELVCSNGGCILHVVTEEPLPAAELQGLPYVEWWEPIRASPDRAWSIGKLLHVDAGAEIGPAAEQGVAATEHSIEGDALTVSLVGDREDLAERVRDYEAAGASPTIERLAEYGGDADVLDGLTERQETVLREAHERGYFEVPREATTADVASALDLDDSTVSEHLQRAQRTILDDLLAE